MVETLADFMRRCARDYYAQQEPFGPRGDFITAPEVSSLFGEMLGLRISQAFPQTITLLELGPGRGTLSADLLRLRQRLKLPTANVCFYEFSPRLQALQRASVPEAVHVSTLEQIPRHHPVCLVANEFFDAWPVHVAGAFVHSDADLNESRLVIDPGVPLREHRPEAERFWQQACALVAQTHGMAIVADYGYFTPPNRLTARGFYRHTVYDVTHRPGQTDVTADVDFAALAQVAQTAGLQVRLQTQGDYLRGLGIEALCAHRARFSETVDQNERVKMLCDAEHMGERFKVLECTPHP